MAFTDEQLAQLHAELGTTLDTVDLDARYTRLGSLNAVILEVLRQRRADLLVNPASFTLSGVLSVNASANLQVLDARIRAFERLVAAENPDGLAAGVGTLYRTDRAR